MKYFKYLFLLFFIPLTIKAKIVEIDVEVVGIGDNKTNAIKDALINAISQVNGQYLASENKIELTSKIESIDGGAEETGKVTELSNTKIDEITNGVVKRFKVISNKQDKNGLFEAKVLATIASYENTNNANRLKVAVLPFYYENKNESDSYNQQAIDKANQWKREIETGFVQFRKFQVIDKEYDVQLNAELQSYQSKEYQIDELSRLGQKIGADYIITGLVIPGKQSQLNPGKVKFKLALKIIDLATRQIKYSKEISNIQKGLKQIIDAIYPIPVLNIEQDQITIGIGGDFIKLGDHFELIKLGEQLNDPYTGEKLGYQETTISDVEIEKVYAKTSKGKIIHEKVNLDEIQYKPGKFILRAIQINQGNKPPGEDILQSEDW